MKLAKCQHPHEFLKYLAKVSFSYFWYLALHVDCQKGIEIKMNKYLRDLPGVPVLIFKSHMSVLQQKFVFCQKSLSNILFLKLSSVETNTRNQKGFFSGLLT